MTSATRFACSCAGPCLPTVYVVVPRVALRNNISSRSHVGQKSANRTPTRIRMTNRGIRERKKCSFVRSLQNSAIGSKNRNLNGSKRDCTRVNKPLVGLACSLGRRPCPSENLVIPLATRRCCCAAATKNPEMNGWLFSESFLRVFSTSTTTFVEWTIPPRSGVEDVQSNDAVARRYGVQRWPNYS